MLEPAATSESAFISNRLLATFPMDLREALRDQIEIVRLNPGDTVLRRGAGVGSALFPFGPTMISIIVDLSEGRSVEVARLGGKAPSAESLVVAMPLRSLAPKR